MNKQDKRCCQICPHSSRDYIGLYWCNENPEKPKRILKSDYDNETDMDCNFCGRISDE